LIKNAMSENAGKRIIILTGAEHKHYFDIALAKVSNAKLVNIKNILPLEAYSPNANMSSFLKENLAYGYFDESTPEGVDQLYSAALMPLIHGMGMDFDPNIIPSENLQKAKSIIDKWNSLRPGSAFVQFETAWVEFLSSDYENAAVRLEKITGRLDEIPEAQQKFVKSFIYRNLGFCYDLMGNRDKAVEYYNKGEDYCKKLELSDAYIKYVYKDYKDNPFTMNKQNQ